MIFQPLTIIKKTALLLCFITLSEAAYADAPAEVHFTVSTFNIEGESPLSNEVIRSELSKLEGKKYGINGLLEAAQKVEDLIRDAGFSFYRVILPPQDVNSGQVTLKIVSIKLGAVDIKGNHHFDNANILASLPELQLGRSSNLQTLSHQVKVANHHPDKNLNVTFKQSDVADEITAKIDVRDTKPYEASLLVNNTGSDDTGNARITAAYDYNNLWNKDHRISLSYTTSPNQTQSVKQYGINYSAPLYSNNGWLSTYYVKSEVDTGQLSLGNDTSLDISGAGEIFGLHYLKLFQNIGQYSHQLDIGIDNRFFDNTSLLSSPGSKATDISPEVRSTPLTLSYSGNTSWKSISIGQSISWSKNLELGSRNDAIAYSETRYKSKSNWDLIRYGLFASISSETHWQLRANLTGQYSNEALIPGEQFGLGGSYSIRGYNEREVGADNGQALALELYAPSWNNISFLTFYDYGAGRNKDALPGEQDRWILASAGLGLRWYFENKIQTSIDWGHALRNGVDTQKGHDYIHASLTLRF